jgi:toxin ParE1/3/4
MQVRWLRKALANLDEAADYTAKDSPSAARAMVAEAFRLTDLLADNPDMGRPGRVPGTRELIMTRHPYIIPYRVRSGCVEVLRFFHGARQWPEAI